MSKEVIAIIGTREPSERQQDAVVEILESLDPEVHRIVSGCADGVDALALSVAKTMGFTTIGIIPWPKYNRHVQEHCDKVLVMDSMHFDNKHVVAAQGSVKQHHPNYGALTQGAFKLHMRNYGIIRWASKVYALPSDKVGGGGTGQGMRLAAALNIPIEVTAM